MQQVNWQYRRDVLICVICVGIIIWAAWGILGQFFDAILLLLFAMTAAFLITPGVNFLTKYAVPRSVATIAIYIVILAVVGGIGYALIFSFVSQVTAFSDTVINFFKSVPTTFSNFIRFLEVQGGIPDKNVQAAISQIQGQVTGFANAAVSNALNIVLLVSNTFLNFVIVVVLSFYLTLDGKRLRDSMIGGIPEKSRSHVLMFEDALNRVVGNYIRGQLTLAVIIGVLAAVICAIAGLGQFALIFGVLGFLFETIPMIGPFLASILPIIVSLLLPDPFPRTAYILIGFIVIQMIESNVLGPRIVGHAIGLHPVVSIMALLIFAKLFGSAFGAFGGAVGALIATPLVAAAWVVVSSLYRSARGETPDQILSRRRAPWQLRRPTMPARLKLRRQGNKVNGVEKPPNEVPTQKTEHMDFIADLTPRDGKPSMKENADSHAMPPEVI